MTLGVPGAFCGSLGHWELSEDLPKADQEPALLALAPTCSNLPQLLRASPERAGMWASAPSAGNFGYYKE